MIEFTDKMGRLIVLDVKQKHADDGKLASADRTSIEDNVLELLRHAPRSSFIAEPIRN